MHTFIELVDDVLRNAALRTHILQIVFILLCGLLADSEADVQHGTSRLPARILPSAAVVSLTQSCLAKPHTFQFALFYVKTKVCR